MREPRTELHALLERVQEVRANFAHPDRNGVAYDCLRMFEEVATELLACRRAHSAVADELLEALKNCVYGLGCQPGYVNTLALSQARAAIAKAEEKP